MLRLLASLLVMAVLAPGLVPFASALAPQGGVPPCCRLDKPQDCHATAHVPADHDSPSLTSVARQCPMRCCPSKVTASAHVVPEPQAITLAPTAFAASETAECRPFIPLRQDSARAPPLTS